jgi:hypothetical protein
MQSVLTLPSPDLAIANVDGPTEREQDTRMQSCGLASGLDIASGVLRSRNRQQLPGATGTRIIGVNLFSASTL